MPQPLMFITISIVLAACAPTPNHVGATPAQSTAIMTQPACQPSQTLPSKNDFSEIRGTMKSDGEMWALLFFDKAYAKRDEKIVWRITGTGKQFDVQSQHEVSYGMPCFALKGNLVYFSVAKNHIGFYPTPSGIQEFKDELSIYEGAKGSVQFPKNKPLPLKLISKIVKFRVAENLKKAEIKSSKRN